VTCPVARSTISRLTPGSLLPSPPVAKKPNQTLRASCGGLTYPIRLICVAAAAGLLASVRAQKIRLIWIHVLVLGRVALAGAALPGTQAMAVMSQRPVMGL
jgi:hypothetical protein